MTATDHPLRTAVLDSLQAFNAGAMDAVVRQFAPDVSFTAPGHSAVAGVYRGERACATLWVGCTSYPAGP